ncbi:hypothetical protein M1271_00970 [Patescibacteria group bacterium]|nr:hypothetical protein [Patescibacteria group bacterium]
MSYPPVPEMRMSQPLVAPRENLPVASPIRPVAAEHKARIVTPEAKNRAQAILASKKQALEAEQRRLAWNLKQGNCIRLDQLTRDYDNEILRYQQALDGLAAGDNGQARDLLEQQICRNLQSSAQLRSYQSEMTQDYVQAGGQLQEARNMLNTDSNDRLRYSNPQELDMAINKMLLEQVYQANPAWRGSKNPVFIASRDAEVVRLKNMLALTTPDQLLSQARKLAQNPKDANGRLGLFVQIQFKEISMLEEQRGQMHSIVQSHENLERENLEMDGLVIDLGGQLSNHPDRLSQRQQILQQLKNAAETDPAKSYEQILQSAKESGVAVEQNFAATYRQIADERAKVEYALKKAESKHNDRVVRLHRLRLSRLSLLEYRLSETYNIHRQKNPGKNPPALKELAATNQMEEQRQPEASAKPQTNIARSPTIASAPMVNKPAASPTASNRQESAAPPVEMKIKTSIGKSQIDQIIDESHGAWRTVNSRVVAISVLNELEGNLGYSFPLLDRTEIAYGIPKTVMPDNISLNPDGQPPAAWLEIDVPVGPGKPARRVAINNTAELNAAIAYAKQVRLLDGRLNPHPMSLIHLVMRDDIAQQFTVDRLRQNPQVLNQIASDLIHFSDQSQPPKRRLESVRFTI